jgi:hypothetical protein
MTATKASIVKELIDFLEEHEDYTYAQVHYAFFRPYGNLKRTDKLSDLLELRDEQVLTNLERAKTIENEG